MLWEIETLQTLTRWRRTKVDQTALSILHFCITFLNSKRVVLPQKTNKQKKRKGKSKRVVAP